MLDVGKAEPLHLFIFRLAQLSAEAHARPGGEHGGAYAAQKSCQCQQNHFQTRKENIVPVAGCHAHVHHIAHGPGQHQLQNGLHNGAQNAAQNPQAVAFGVGQELFDHSPASSLRLSATRRR